MEAEGAVVLVVTVIEDVAVHPLLPVTVTVYVPAALIVNAALVPTTDVPSDQE
jgi:Kef-type K+ transport system membrane component KefB